MALARRKFVEEYKAEVTTKKEDVVSGKFLSTGSTLLNLAMTDRIDGGWVLGTFNNLVGDSDTGKTLLMLTAFAEANQNPFFKDYDLYYDEPEAKSMFDLNKFKLADRLIRDITSTTIQEWQANLWKLSGEKREYIYVLDSFDSVGSEEERERFDGMVKQMTKGETVETKGSFNSEKPKGSGQLIREVKARVKDTASLMVVISQTRDNIGVMFGDKKTRSGGHALKFYSTHEPWLRVKEPLKKKDRKIGSMVHVKLKKNHYNGKYREVEFPVYGAYGVDDIGSQIDWIVKEGFWRKNTGGKIDTCGDFPGGNLLLRDDLISYIEAENMEESLKVVTQESWDSIEKEIAINRKGRY